MTERQGEQEVPSRKNPKVHEEQTEEEEHSSQPFMEAAQLTQREEESRKKSEKHFVQALPFVQERQPLKQGRQDEPEEE